MLSGTQWSQRSVRSGEFLAQHPLPSPFCHHGLILPAFAIPYLGSHQDYVKVLFCCLWRRGGRRGARTPRAPAKGGRPLHSGWWLPSALLLVADLSIALGEEEGGGRGHLALRQRAAALCTLACGRLFNRPW